MGIHFSVYARLLCKDSRHFLSEPSITGHYLCEDFPIFLLGGIGAPGIWQRTFRISRYMGVLLPEKQRRRPVVFMFFEFRKSQKVVQNASTGRQNGVALIFRYMGYTGNYAHFCD